MFNIYRYLLILCPSIFYAQFEAEKDVVRTLCSPNYHGRGYVNNGDSLAAELIALEFQKRGGLALNNTYFQNFSFPVNTFPDKMSAATNSRSLVPGVDFMVDPASAGYTGILKSVYFPVSAFFDKKIETVFLQKITATNNVLIVLPVLSFKKDSLKLAKEIIKTISLSYATAQLYNSKFTWSVADEQSKYLQLWIQESAINAAKDSLITLDITAQFNTKHNTRNVIASFPSKAKNAKTIFFTAHYDHLGRMGNSTYFPGANDNASGVGLLLNLMTYYKSNPSKYTLVFIAFAGEEAGLLGSQHYVQNPLLPLQNIRFLLNLDIMGSGEDGITVVNGTLHEKEFKALEKINAKKSYLKLVKIRGKAANSDHYFFSEMGVPAFFIYAMGPNKNYHDIEDKFENLSFSEYNDLTHLIIDFVKRLKK